MKTVVSAVSLYKQYGDTIALENVSLELGSGELVCVVGPNGAGKTTLMESILGIKQPDKGEVYIFGEKISGRMPSRLLRDIGALLEDAKLLPWITVSENLRMIAELYGVKVTDSDIRSVLTQVGLNNEASARLYSKLSFGQKRKVDLAATLITDPKLLILDDPFVGLDPLARLEVLKVLKRIKANRTILYATHLLDIASRFSDRVVMLFGGKIIAEDRAASLINRYGGWWRVRLLAREKAIPGFKQVGFGEFESSVKSPSELLSIIKHISSQESIEELYIEPPTLQEVFERLTKRGEL